MSGHGKKLVQTKLFAGKNTVGFLKTCEYIGLLPVLFQVLDPVGLLLDLLLLIRPHKLIQKGGGSGSGSPFWSEIRPTFL